MRAAGSLCAGPFFQTMEGTAWGGGRAFFRGTRAGAAALPQLISSEPRKSFTYKPHILLSEPGPTMVGEGEEIRKLIAAGG